MAPSSERPSRDARPRRSTWRERAFVLGGPALAVPVTAAAPAPGPEDHVVGLVWAAALAWTGAASLACALRRGIAQGDWSAFTGYELPDGSGERLDWDTRTGVYAYMRIREDRERLLEDDGLRNRDSGI